MIRYNNLKRLYYIIIFNKYGISVKIIKILYLIYFQRIGKFSKIRFFLAMKNENCHSQLDRQLDRCHNPIHFRNNFAFRFAIIIE